MSPDVKRILYVEANDDSTVGGSHQALMDLAIRVDRRRFEPLALFYRDNPFLDRLKAQNVNAVHIEPLRQRELRRYRSQGRVGRTLTALGAVRARMRLIRDHQVDLVHVINSPRITADDWLPAAKCLGVPCVASDMLMEAFGRPGRIQQWMMRGFNWTLPVSGHQEEILRRYGMPEDRMTRIYHGVDVVGLRDAARTAPERVRAELGVGDGRVLVLMVANVREWKGQHVVLEALGKLAPPVLERVVMVFVGSVLPEDRPYHDRLAHLIGEHGLDAVVKFEGFRDDVPDLLRAADIVVHASTKTEPGGIAVLEALALGRPVVASRFGGHAEVIGSDAGRLFDPSKPDELALHLGELIQGDDERQRLGQAAWDRMNDFTIERNVEETQAVYARVLAR